MDKKMQKAAFQFAIVLAGSSSDVFDSVLTLKAFKELLGPQTEFYGPYFKDSDNGFVVCKHTNEFPQDAIAYPCGPSITADTDYKDIKVGVLTDEKTKATAFIFFTAKANEPWVI